MLTGVTRNNEIGAQIRGKTLLSGIQNQIYVQSVKVALAEGVIIYRQAEKDNCGINPRLTLLPDNTKYYTKFVS